MKDSFETRATRRHEHSLSLEAVSRKRKWFLPGDYRAGLVWAEVFSATDPMLVTVTALHRSIVGCQEKALISSAKCHLVAFSIFDGCFSVLWGWRMHDVTLCGSPLHGDHCSSQICFLFCRFVSASCWSKHAEDALSFSLDSNKAQTSKFTVFLQVKILFNLLNHPDCIKSNYF